MPVVLSHGKVNVSESEGAFPMKNALARILESWYEHPREIFLFFYYPADAYISYLITVNELEFYDEIECDDLFAGNDPQERIMIFQLPDYELE